jgi:hypothetical protein
MAVRNAGNPNMLVGAREVTDMRSEITFGDLAVIEIKLELEVVTPDFAQDRYGLGSRVEEIAGVVAFVERLDQQRDSIGRGAVGGTAQIADIDRGRLAPVRSRWQISRHCVKPLAVGRHRVFERAFKIG